MSEKKELFFQLDPILQDLEVKDKYWGLVVNTNWPPPSSLKEQYENFIHQIQKLDSSDSIYLYPFSHLHITVAIIISFKSSSFDPKRKTQQIEKWKEVITYASTLPDWPSKPFQVKINQPNLSSNAAFFTYTPLEPFLNIRKCILQASQQFSKEDPELYVNEIAVPNIVHTSIMRFKKVPSNPNFENDFQKIASIWNPVELEIREIYLVVEDIPYMHITKDANHLLLSVKFQT